MAQSDQFANLLNMPGVERGKFGGQSMNAMKESRSQGGLAARGAGPSPSQSAHGVYNDR